MTGVQDTHADGTPVQMLRFMLSGLRNNIVQAVVIYRVAECIHDSVTMPRSLFVVTE